MPPPAQRAAVGGALALDPGDGRGVEGVALRAVAALAGAHALPLVGRGFLHGKQAKASIWPQKAQKAQKGMATKNTRNTKSRQGSFFVIFAFFVANGSDAVT